MEVMLQAQSPHVSEMEGTPGEKIHYVYDAAAEKVSGLKPDRLWPGDHGYDELNWRSYPIKVRMDHP